MSDKPPSRERYEAENPTVSFRISRDKKAELDALVKDLDTTKKEWFESIIDGERQHYDEVRESAWQEGYDVAKEEFQVTVPCAVCGESVILSPEHREDLFQLLERLSRRGPFTSKPPAGHPIEWNYGHEECLQ